MSALMSLTAEHQMISELLDALQTYAARLRGSASVDPVDLGRFSEVFRELVDYRHHEKEEGILMPFLARNGFEWSTGLLAELRREHGHLRYLVDVLSQAAAKDSLGSREGRRQIAETAAAFVEFKHRHIQKEEQVLLPAVAQRLSPKALERLAAELHQFDEATGRTLAMGTAPAVGTALAGSAASSANASHALIVREARELVQRYLQDPFIEESGVVDVTGVVWQAAHPSGVATSDAASRARRDSAGVGLTSSGRSR